MQVCTTYIHVGILRIGYKSQCTLKDLYIFILHARGRARGRCKSTFFQPAVHDVNNVLNWISDLSSLYYMHAGIVKYEGPDMSSSCKKKSYK